jgi:uncharacterized membrane protein (UPF0127 family)
MRNPCASRIAAARLLAVVIAVAFALSGAAVGESRADDAEPAALSCANSELPPAILAGPSALPSKKRLQMIRVSAPRAQLNLAVADTPEKRELGLMCVTRLRPHAGMLFVFGQRGEWDFWMKNTLISLDMIWLESNGTVSTVAENVPASKVTTPDDAVARRSGDGLYVIELAGGEAASDGIVKGTKLVLPVPAVR